MRAARLIVCWSCGQRRKPDHHYAYMCAECEQRSIDEANGSLDAAAVSVPVEPQETPE